MDKVRTRAILKSLLHLGQDVMNDNELDFTRLHEPLRNSDLYSLECLLDVEMQDEGDCFFVLDYNKKSLELRLYSMDVARYDDLFDNDSPYSLGLIAWVMNWLNWMDSPDE